MSVIFFSLHKQDDPFPYTIDVPMSSARAQTVGISPIALWCQEEFGPLHQGWTYQRRGDTVRFHFTSEEAAERFVSKWTRVQERESA